MWAKNRAFVSTGSIGGLTITCRRVQRRVAAWHGHELLLGLDLREDRDRLALRQLGIVTRVRAEELSETGLKRD